MAKFVWLLVTSMFFVLSSCASEQKDQGSRPVVLSKNLQHHQDAGIDVRSVLQGGKNDFDAMQDQRISDGIIKRYPQYAYCFGMNPSLASVEWSNAVRVYIAKNRESLNKRLAREGHKVGSEVAQGARAEYIHRNLDKYFPGTLTDDERTECRRQFGEKWLVEARYGRVN